MSIQIRSYTSKKTGKKATKYHAVVYDQVAKKHVWSDGFTERKEAVKEEARMTRELERHSIVKSKVAFSEAAEECFASRKAQWAKSTYKTYLSFYNRYIAPVFGEREINAITARHVQTFVNEMNEKYAPETVNKMRNALTVVFQYAINIMDVNMDNPCIKVKGARIPKPHHTTWTKEQTAYFLDTGIVTESIYYEMLVLSSLAGIRPEEVCGIREDALVDGDRLILDRAYDRDKNITDMKTTDSHRMLNLPEKVADKLRSRLVEKGEWRRSPSFKDSDFMFCREDGSLVKPDCLSRNFRKLVNKNNKLAEDGEKGYQTLPVIRLYDLRHSVATNMIMDEATPDKVVCEILGNSVKTLLHHYSHVRAGVQGQALANYAAGML
jgi:integrase